MHLHMHMCMCMQHAASNLSYSAQPRITRCIERHIAYHIGERRGGVRTISRRLSHPSPKLSNSSTVTSMTAVSSNTDGGGEGCGGIDGGGSAGVGGGGEGSTSAQLGAPKVAFTKKAARADLGEPRPTSVGESERDASCLRRLSNASRSSNAVRCVGELGDCSHNLTVVTPPATTCMVKSSEFGNFGSSPLRYRGSLLGPSRWPWASRWAVGCAVVSQGSLV